MKKTINALKFCTVCLVIISSLLACDSEFTSVDSDVLGENNTNFQTNKELLPILAYNKKLDSLQIDGLPSTLLGVFNDPIFGQTTASFITQVTPSTYSPSFGENTVIDSVVLTIPYYSRVTGIDNQGLNEYTLSDSLYGNANAPIKLTVFKNEYFLRDFDPTSIGEEQHYYSKADGAINMTDNFALNGSSIINFDDHKFTFDTILNIESFLPDPRRIRLDTKDENGEITATTYNAPAIRYKLDTDFWKTTIIDKEDYDVLTSASKFQNYFRGLYFKTEAVDSDGYMVMLNLASANIVIYYSNEATSGNSYTLNLSGKKLNTFINDFNLADGDSNTGDSKLNIKGLEGSMAVVSLFPTNEDLKAFLDTYRTPTNDPNQPYKTDENGNYVLRRLINDVHLIVYEDESLNTDQHKYDRLYAYDIKNNTVLVDYSYDPISNTSFPINSKIVHLGQRKEDDNGVKYKISITEHLKNIVLNDSTNTDIGLVLSTNVNATSSAKILNSEDQDVTGVPAASIITPRGTVLHGTNSTVPDDVKMRLEVFFTEPK